MFKLEFETANAAFDEAPSAEIARIMREVTDRIDLDAQDGVVRDINGNKIGSWSYTRD